MGIFLNPENSPYKEAVNAQIFVDHSEMIHYLNSVTCTLQKYVCVTCPEGFGKTMAADMVCAYYGKGMRSRVLFRKLKLAQSQPSRKAWDSYLGKFYVIRLNMTDFIREDTPIEDSLASLQTAVVQEMKAAHPEIRFNDEGDLLYAVGHMYSATRTQFVFVIDDWDAPIRLRRHDLDGHRQYLDFLRDLLKDNHFIALAYMTGILPIQKNGNQTSLNMFSEFTMTGQMQMAPFTGFTEEEVRDLCERYSQDFDSISTRCGGYRAVRDIPIHLREQVRTGEYKNRPIPCFCPRSVVRAMMGESPGTGLYDHELADLIHLDLDGMPEAVASLMEGKRVRTDLGMFQNNMTTLRTRDDVLTLLIHLGYLAYEGDMDQGYIDLQQGEVFIPNSAVMEVFRAAVRVPAC